MDGFDRRRNCRVNIPGTLRGSIGLVGVRVINLSPTGTLIEHRERLSPGQTSIFGLRLAGVDLRLPARVAWCRVHSVLSVPGGEGELRYRSGLHFSDLPQGAEAHLREYLASLGAAKVHPGHRSP